MASMGYRPGGLSSDEDSEDEFGCFGPPIPRTVRPPVILLPHEILLKAAQAGDYASFIAELDRDKNKGEELVNYVYASHRHWSILMFACSGRNLELINCLLECGANPNHRSSDGYCPILALATSHDATADPQSERTIEGIKLLVKYGADVKASERPGASPIALVARNNRIELVQYFIENGLDINGKDTYQSTALHFAAQFGYRKLMRLLLDHGADAMVADQEGCTPYTKALENGQEKLGAILNLVETTEWRPGQDPATKNVAKTVLSLHESNYLRRYILPEKSQIAMFLSKISLDSLIPLFEAQDINYLTFLRITDDDLKDIGVTNGADRQAILETIQSIRAASWNTAANSHFLQGFITLPEVLCLLSDVATYSKKLENNATTLNKAVLQNPNLFQVGKETFTMMELIVLVESSIKSSRTFCKSVLHVKSVLLEENATQDEKKQMKNLAQFWSRPLLGCIVVIPLAVGLSVLTIKKLRH